MNIGLLDFDSKIVNLPIMKLAHWHKLQGDTVVLNPSSSVGLDKVYCSVLFSWNREKAAKLVSLYPNIEFGGTGWDLDTVLPEEIENLRPDYDLYQVEDIVPRIRGIMSRKRRLEKATTIVNAGIGHTSRGCTRSCGFCIVKDKKGEGPWHPVAEIKDLLNPRSHSKVLILLDNNLTADPYCLDKLTEIRERDLTVDISQGIDIRTMTPDIARALASIKHLRSLHYAFDLVQHEEAVVRGIKTLSQFIKPYRHLCFLLVGFNTTFLEDMHRFKLLTDMNVSPYIMVFNHKADIRLRHMARWVNSRIYTVCPDFEQYQAWAQTKEAYFSTQQLNLSAA